MAQQILVDAGPHLIALGAPLGKLLLIFGGAFPRVSLLFLDLGRFLFQLRLRGLHFLVARIRIQHQLKNLVFGGGDFLFRKLDLVQQRFVLFVGFYVEGLVAVLGNLAAQVGDRSIVLAAGGFIGLDRGLGLFQSSLGVGQLMFNGGDAFREFGNLLLQAADFLVRILQAQQVFYF